RDRRVPSCSRCSPSCQANCSPRKAMLDLGLVELGRINARAIALNLALNPHEDIARRLVDARYDRQARHSLATHNRDLRLTAFSSPDRHYGGGPAFGAMHLSDRSVR